MGSWRPARRRSGTSTQTINPRSKRLRIRDGSLVNKFLAVITLLCMAAWGPQSDGGNYKIWPTRYAASAGSWGAPRMIGNDDPGRGFNAQIELAVWRQSDSNTSSSIRWVRYTTASDWGTAAAIEPGDGAFVREPQIACDSSGNALAARKHRDNTRSEIRSSRFTVADVWAAAPDAGNTGDVVDPVMAMDSAGNAIAVWQQVDSSGAGLVLSNRFE